MQSADEERKLAEHLQKAGELLKAGQLEGAEKEIDAADVQVGIDQIAEMAIPFERLGVKVDQPLQFFVELLQDKQSRDRAPREGSITMARPSPDFEQIMWDV